MDPLLAFMLLFFFGGWLVLILIKKKIDKRQSSNPEPASRWIMAVTGWGVISLFLVSWWFNKTM
ncbi:hypothetical protein B4N84_12335 [Flavobacterium sp. IR1]|nr:hypothetical protein B4N84_12335 [Flavobacterium sp. IR1]